MVYNQVQIGIDSKNPPNTNDPNVGSPWTLFFYLNACSKLLLPVNDQDRRQELYLSYCAYGSLSLSGSHPQGLRMRTNFTYYRHQGDCKAVLEGHFPHPVDQGPDYANLFLKYTQMTTHPLANTLQMLLCCITMQSLPIVHKNFTNLHWWLFFAMFIKYFLPYY